MPFDQPIKNARSAIAHQVPAVPPVAYVSEADSILSDACQLADRLGTMVAELQRRLGPVMRPMAEQESGKLPAAPYSAQLFIEISSYHGAAHESMNKLREVIDSLAI